MLGINCPSEPFSRDQKIGESVLPDVLLRRCLIIRTFTLDTNCIIAIDEQRPEAIAIRELANAHASGDASVAIVAISASERQKGPPVENFTQFQERLAGLGLGHINVLPALLYLDISFLDNSLLADQAMELLEKRIHEVLFPNIEFLWADFCVSSDQSGVVPRNASVWRNAKCDVQALWSHVHHSRNVFVTSDRNFHQASKRNALIALGANNIAYPDEAAALL